MPTQYSSLRELKLQARGCRACPLWVNATQTVFGEGPADAAVMLVGEQPGDKEDLEGKPFIGPAGQLLDKALEAAEVDRRLVYVSNAVKHFKWTPRGKRRMHKKPSDREVAACFQWLEGELQALHPRVLVCLGATAAMALLGKEFRVSRQRGQRVSTPHAPYTFATVHPSALLRIRDSVERGRAFGQFVNDLRLIHEGL